MILTKVSLRVPTAEERHALEQLAHARTAQARLVERAQILLALADGQRPSQVARQLGLSRPTIYTWIHRFNERGLHGLEDRPRSGRPHTYTAEQRAEVIAAALTDPKRLGLPFGCWTLDRLRAYLNEQKGIPIKRSRIGEILVDEGLKWRHQETWFGARVDPDFAETRGSSSGSTRTRRRGVSSSVSTRGDRSRPRASRDSNPSTPGPSERSSRSSRSPEAVATAPEPGVEPPVTGPPPVGLSTDAAAPEPGVERPLARAERAKQEIDYGRRGKGYIFGAFRPATGAALTHPYPSRSAANWADFLGRVEAWIPAQVERVYAIVDHLQAHRAVDVLLFALAFARWEFVFQPKYAAYLNLIEPWWKVLRSLALKGRRFESWEEVCRAVEEATAYWNKHRHPFVWGRRRRHRPRRRPGIASVPGIRGLTG